MRSEREGESDMFCLHAVSGLAWTAVVPGDLGSVRSCCSHNSEGDVLGETVLRRYIWSISPEYSYTFVKKPRRSAAMPAFFHLGSLVF